MIKNFNLSNIPMIPINLNYFYTVGAEIHPLLELKKQENSNEIYYLVRTAYTKLIGMLEMNLFSISFESANKLKSSLENYINNYENDPTVPIDTIDIIINAYNFEITYQAELSHEQVYVVTPKGAYNAKILILNPSQAFHPELLNTIPEVQYDVEQAAKCLVFELPTATAFHLHRINETVLHKYWDIVSSNQPRPGFSTVGQYIQEMKTKNLGNKDILECLEQINKLHRNPILHPQENLTSQEAIELFGIINSAISAMLNEICKPSINQP